jgi:excisionase family DNA binding protein
MLNVKQVAAELGISPALVYALCAAGKLEHERYGLGRGTIRITPEALKKFREASQGNRTEPRVRLKHIRLPSNR